MATEWPAASCHGTVTGVGVGWQFFLIVFSNEGMRDGMLKGILVPTADPKNLGFFAKGMDCCMFRGKAKAAVARKQRTYNAEVLLLVHIVVRSIGRGERIKTERYGCGIIWIQRAQIKV